MSTTPHGTIEETGAKANELLFGINPLNQDLLIEVLSDQEASGKRVSGSFILLRAGNGAYSELLKEHEGRVMEAGELISFVLKAEGKNKKNLHILNRNQLKKYQKSIPDIQPSEISHRLAESHRGISATKPATLIGQKISESQLEALLIENLDLLEPGLKLVTQQLDCREAGRLDLLCESKSGDLVVVEIKRFGVRHESILDQILRYMGYVRIHHLKQDDQRVRGIIVVGRVDERLRYALAAVPDVSVKTFDLTIR
jgi:hypothetical protein